jgi:hypothetical protein
MHFFQRTRWQRSSGAFNIAEPSEKKMFATDDRTK